MYRLIKKGNSMKKILIIWVLLMGVSFAEKMDTTYNEVGANIGWGNPLGASLEYNRKLTQADLIGGGVGISMAGFRYGVGYKHLFLSDAKISPYVGIAAAKSSGIPEITVRVNSDSALYKVESGVSTTPRLGARFQNGDLAIYLNLGYGILLSGGKIKFLEGERKDSLDDFASLMGAAGVEVSLSGRYLF